MSKSWVVKRNGRRQDVAFDKIIFRINKLCWGLQNVNAVEVAQQVIAGFKNGMSTSELDNLAAETCAYWTTRHYEYGELAARIAISNLQKSTSKSFMEVSEKLYRHTTAKTETWAPMIAKDVYEFIVQHKDALENAIMYDRDFKFDYFGFQTLRRSYLFKIHGVIVERPQHMWMRVACGLHTGHLENVLETYHLLSNHYFTHATPTLYNAGTPRPQLASCFLMTMQEDSIEGIFETLKQCAVLSKHAGGIGLRINDIRAKGTYIAGTNGTSNGLVPMLRVFNQTACYVDQGGGKRKGSFAVYLEPWHADLWDWLLLKNNNGVESNRARDLFFGLMIPDLFMRRVEANANWSFFCPHEVLGLGDLWGPDFDQKYQEYEAVEGLARQTVPARDVWKAILAAHEENGVPYMVYKDACNAKSNQQHLGTLTVSNLCTEIIEYVSPDEIAVCTLASICLPMFVKEEECIYDYQQLEHVTRVVTKNLNRCIDVNFYPLPQTQKSNLRHRPIGLGPQGLDDAFKRMRFPYDSPQAVELNRLIAETIYYAACSASADLAERDGPYETFIGSPMSKGHFQFDLWGVKPTPGRYDWDALRKRIMTTGIRNSLLVAPMPTATTSQILGNTEAFYPVTSNLYVRRTLAGEFVCLNKSLMKDLLARDLWNEDLRNEIIAHHGSVQHCATVPDDLKALYKTAWEIKNKVCIDMAADRGAFTCQSQSLNLHMSDVTYEKLTSMHFYAWKKGLKTGMYYLHTRPAADAIPFTVDQQRLEQWKRTSAQEASQKKLKRENGEEREASTKRVKRNEEEEVCTRGNGCESCGG